MTAIQKIWIGSRPKTWSNAIAPVCVGVGAAWKTPQFRHDGYTILLLFALSLGLIMTVNFANDYADGIKGNDNSEYRLGAKRLVGAGIASPRFVKNTAIVVTMISAFTGVLLCWHIHSWELLIVGIGCVLLAWGYTSGPAPLAYYGLGEITVFIVFGLVAVLGSEYACSTVVTIPGIIGAISMGCFSSSIMVTNNIRDIDSDTVQGKTTLAVRLGYRYTRWLYLFLVTVPLVLAAILAIHNTWMLLEAMVAVPIMYASWMVCNQRGVPLLKALSMTSVAMMLWAVIYVGAYSIGG